MSDFRRLAIWQRARALSVRVDNVVRRLPPEERRRRGDQLIRTAVSIRLNISEGSGRGTPGQFAQSLRYAIGSANELEDAIEELNDVGLLSAEDRDLLTETSNIAAMIAGFRKRILQNSKESR